MNSVRQRDGYMNTRRAIGYVRVSTDKQAEAGLSLEAQTEKIRAMAIVRSVELGEILTDPGESAKSLDRPGMAQLLALVDAGAVDTVIIAKLDRLTRSVADLADLLTRFECHDVALISMAEALDTSTASGRLVLNIMVSVSQWEREAIAERTRDVMQHKRANGQRVGTLPFGARVSGDGVHLEPDAGEQEILLRVRDLRAAGRTTNQIAAALNREGFTTRRGTPWRGQYVARQLSLFGGKVLEGARAFERAALNADCESARLPVHGSHRVGSPESAPCAGERG